MREVKFNSVTSTYDSSENHSYGSLKLCRGSLRKLNCITFNMHTWIPLRFVVVHHLREGSNMEPFFACLCER